MVDQTNLAAQRLCFQVGSSILQDLCNKDLNNIVVTIVTWQQEGPELESTGVVPFCVEFAFSSSMGFLKILSSTIQIHVVRLVLNDNWKS